MLYFRTTTHTLIQAIITLNLSYRKYLLFLIITRKINLNYHNFEFLLILYLFRNTMVLEKTNCKSENKN